MTDTDFAFGDSLLFLNTQPSADPPQEPTALAPQQQENMEFSGSLLFPLETYPSSDVTTAQTAPTAPDIHDVPVIPSSTAAVIVAADPVPELGVRLQQNKVKSAKLLDGTTVFLLPRRKKQITLDFSEDPDAILNMDKLYERVERRKLLQATKNKIRELKQKNKAPETSGLSHLWMDKYKPKSYLLICHAGNERQYRLVLNWLHKWDAVVFGKLKEVGDSVDNLGRPLRKVLLIHGPPGMGKTAVAHLLARLAGYSVEELNAANSMNALQGADAADGAGRFANATAALKLKVKNALTTNSITSNGKPTCLIVDEIDSAINAGDIVKVISDLVRTDQTNSRKRENQDFRRDPKNKSNKKPFYLNRPIICIANDIYSTTSKSYGANPMELLRPMCELVAFRRPATGSSHGTKINTSAQKSVKEFLMKISEHEKLGLDRKEVAEVFEICDGDIRACINYLQFSSRKLDTDIHNFRPETSAGITNKDSLVSWFTLVDQIFRRNQALSKEENFEEMLDMVSSGEGKSAESGSLDKVIRGCFNKYLDVVHLQDDSAIRPAEMSDWLFYYDLLTTQNLSSHFYPTLATLKFWSLFSDINPQKFRDIDGLIPGSKNLEYSSRETLKQNKYVVKKLADLVPTNSKIALCGTSSNNSFYACEFIPLLDKMLSPEVGSSKSKISLKTHEANLVEKLAGLIKALDIKLESQRDVETNQVHLVYGPDWEGITIFESGEQNLEQKKRSLNVKRQWLFPLLQSEIDSLMSTGLLKRERTEKQDQEKQEAKQKRAKMTSSLDFFKGRYDDMLNKIATVSKPVNREATRIWVKHHEGFSNAVRKNIGWYELWN